MGACRWYAHKVRVKEGLWILSQSLVPSAVPRLAWTSKTTRPFAPVRIVREGSFWGFTVGPSWLTARPALWKCRRTTLRWAKESSARIALTSLRFRDDNRG